MALIFPSDLGNYGFPYWMSFAFYAYNGTAVSTGAAFGGGDGAIRLPLPNNLIDTQQINYSEENLNLAVGAMNAAGAGVAGALGAATATSVVNNIPGVGQAINKGAALLNTPGVLQQAGVAINPFLTVLFKSPAFKRFNFRWKLSSSNSTDSATLNSIINTLKFNQLPSTSSILLTYPNIIQPSINAEIQGQYFTFLFKPCVIEQFQVNYAPSGQPAFFGQSFGGGPVEAEIEMSLLEIEWFLQQDYAGLTSAGPSNANPNLPTTIVNSLSTITNAITGLLTTPPTTTSASNVRK